MKKITHLISHFTKRLNCYFIAAAFITFSMTETLGQNEGFVIQNITVNGSSPTAVGCTPLQICFELVQANEEYDEVPMEDVTVTVFLLNTIFEFIDNPGFSNPGNSTTGINGRLYEVWDMGGVEIPSINDGGTIQICFSVKLAGYLSPTDPGIFISGSHGTFTTGLSGPITFDAIVPITIGSTSTSVTSLAEAITPPFNSLPAGGTSSDVLINGTLEIDITDDYTFTNSQIYMNEGAVIKILGGNELIFKSVKLEGCMEMWNRIEVNTDGALTCEETNPQAVNPVVIRDGEFGIQLHDGATFNMRSTNIVNCNYGISTPITFLPKHFDIHIQRMNTITSDGNMKPPYQGKLPAGGMLLYELSGVNIIGDEDNTIEFSNLARGINAIRSHFTVDRLLFKDIVDDPATSASPSSTEGSAIRLLGLGRDRLFTFRGFGNSQIKDFDGCITGINADQMRLDIRDGRMENVDRGIEVKRSNNRSIGIYENNISARTTGIGLFQNLPATVFIRDNILNIHKPDSETGVVAGFRGEENTVTSIGVYRFWNNEINLDNGEFGVFMQAGRASSFRNNTVNLLDGDREGYFGFFIRGTSFPIARCNLVNGNADPEGSNWRSATGFDLSQVSQGSFRCNELHDTDRGFRFNSVMDATLMRGNEFNEHHYGLEILQSTWIGVQSHNGNQWLGSSYGTASSGPQNGNYGGFILSNEPELSIFKVDETELTEFNTSVNAQDWFVPENLQSSSFYCTTPSNTCPEGLGSSIDEFVDEDPGKDVLDYAIAAGDLTSEYCEEALNWTGKYHLYRRLQAHPELLTGDTTLQNFVNATETTTVGKFYDVEAAITGMMSVDEITQEKLDSLTTIISEKSQETWVIDSTIFTGVSSGMRDTLLQERADHLDVLKTAIASHDTLTVNILSLRSARSAQFQVMNDTITVSEVYEENEKTVNDIFLKTIAVDIDTFTAQQLSDLKDIAGQCPKCGGDAVYRARSLYAFYDATETYDDVALCDYESDPLVLPPASSSSDFTFYPNPSANQVTVRVSRTMERMEREVVIFTLEGREVFRQPLPGDELTLNLNTANLSAGTYFFTVLEKGRKIHTERIVILK